MKKTKLFIYVGALIGFSWFQGCQSGAFVQTAENSPPNFQPGESVSFIVPPSGFLTPVPGTHHEVMILGLKSNQKYTLEVTAPSVTDQVFLVRNVTLTTPVTPLAKLLTFETSVSSTPQVRVVLGELESPGVVKAFQTEPLPDRFPPMQVYVSQPDKMAPGVTIFDVAGNDYVDPYVIAVNAFGEVVWYLQMDLDQIARMANGNLLACDIGSYIREIDMLGNIVREVTNVDIGEPRIHHDCQELPNGNIVTLSMELRNIGPYPPNNEFFNVVGDVYVEFNWDLEILHWFSLHDSLDPFRVISGFDLGLWNSTFGMPTKDWTHGNAVTHDPSDDTFIVSLRHQDLIVKYTKSGEMIWAIGEDDPGSAGDDDWPFITLVGPGTYPNHQHAPELTKHGDLIVYDNANSSGITRPVIYRIDEENLTMTQLWEYIDPERDPPVCAPFVGDADYLDNDNVLIAHMGIADPGGSCAFDNIFILIVEVSSLTNEKVFEMEVRHPLDGFNGYRAERLQSLYP